MFVSARALRSRMAHRTACLFTAFLVVLSGSLVWAPSAQASDYTNYLNQNSTLYPGDSLWTPDHNYRVTQQRDGNLVLYSMPGNKPFWSSGTFSHPGSVTQLQYDGNLVIYAPGHIAIWASNTGGHPNSVLFMQSDANLVLRAPGNVAIWATNAQNIAGCSDNSRTQAAQNMSSNQFTIPVQSVSWQEDPPFGPIGNTLSFQVSLLYNASHRCAWAAGYGDYLSSLWVDRSQDGGRTWSHGAQLGYHSFSLGQSSYYTGVFNDSYPNVMRACLWSDGSNSSGLRCTSWY